MIIRRLPRLSEAKPVASSNPAPTPAAPAPDDRPAVLREGGAKAARNYDDEQREIGRMLIVEGLPIIGELAVDAGRVALDFLRSMASNLTATKAPDNAIVAPSTPPSAPSLPGGPGSQDRVDKTVQEPFGGRKGPIIGEEPSP